MQCCLCWVVLQCFGSVRTLALSLVSSCLVCPVCEYCAKTVSFSASGCWLKRASSVKLTWWGKLLSAFRLLAFQTLVRAWLPPCCAELLVYWEALWIGKLEPVNIIHQWICCLDWCLLCEQTTASTYDIVVVWSVCLNESEFTCVLLLWR